MLGKLILPSVAPVELDSKDDYKTDYVSRILGTLGI